MTSPNQRIVKIEKAKTDRFLQIGIDEWQVAFKELKPSTFAVYLYLSSNADGYNLELSQRAVENVIGIKKTAYHTAINELKEKGYITLFQGNIEIFHTSPVRKCELNNGSSQTRTEQSANTDKPSANTDDLVRKRDREIYNIYNINKTNSVDLSSINPLKMKFDDVDVNEYRDKKMSEIK